MKKHYLILLLLLMSFYGNAYHVVKAEYFWDRDPGVGLGTSITITAPSDSVTFNASISTLGLSSGNHMLYIRTMNNLLIWSLSEGKPYFIYPSISAAEYFWDTDPGCGNGIPLTSFTAADSLNINQTISTVGMSAGFHTLYTRTQGLNNLWSIAEGRSIYISPWIKEGEYFWETDPGLGNGTSFYLDNAILKSDSLNEAIPINTTGKPRGVNNLYVRFKNNDDSWGLTESNQINLVNGIKAAEYYFDTDPGFGLGTAIPINVPDTTINFTGNITLPLLSGGMHKIYFRTQDLDNKWSLSEEKSFYIYINSVQATTINNAEYFFDTDPGQGNGLSMPNVIAASTVNYLDSIVLPQLTGGFHTMFVRTRDNNNHWSHVEPKGIFIYSNSVLASSITAAGYFIDNDAGIANDYPISITAGATVNFNSAIILPSISKGIHTFNLRTRDNNGKWSIHEPRVFFAGSENALQITNAEYFVDADPGVGNATNIAITTPAATVNKCALLTLPTFTTGAHKLYLRTKDNRGIWALQEPISFTGIATSSVSIAPASPVNLCAGSNINLTATTIGGPWTAQWYNGCSPIVGANSLSLNVTAAGTYTIVVTNGSISQTATVVVNNIPLPIQYVVTGGGNYCSSQEGGLEIQLSGCQGDINYQLILNGSTNIGLPVICDGNNITFSDLTLEGNYTISATTIIGGCTISMNNSATITIEQAITWYIDEDADGFGQISVSQESCAQPTGYVSDSTDCEDNSEAGASIHPFAEEVCCNEVDDNCNGQTDEGCFATVNVRLFIQGFYLGNNLMQPVLFNAGLSSNDALCDTVVVELHDPLTPTTLISSDAIVIDINGNGNVNYPISMIGESYYFVIRTRNAIETWSKLPVTLGCTTILDFTTP